MSFESPQIENFNKKILELNPDFFKRIIDETKSTHIELGFIKKSAASMNTDAFIEITKELLRMYPNGTPGVEVLFDKDIGLSSDQKKLFIDRLANADYDFNRLRKDGKTAAHLIAAEHSTDLDLDVYSHLMAKGLDVTTKDDRKWTPQSYLKGDIKKGFDAMRKAIDARSEAQRSVDEIRSLMRP